jgi:hypothetical protein
MAGVVTHLLGQNAMAGGGTASSSRWRLNVTALHVDSGGTGATVLAEVEMRATAGGADECSGGTATASNGTPTGAFADDGTTTTWAAGTGSLPQWIEYDFGTPKTIVEVAITTRSGNVFRDAPATIQVQYYDGATWQTEWTITTGPWGAGETRVFTKTDAAEDRRVWGVKITAHQSTAVGSCTELELRTSPGGANVATGGAPIAENANNSTTRMPASAFDGSSTTFWIGLSGAPTWLGYALAKGSTVDIVEVVFRCRNDAFGPAEAPLDMSFGYWTGNVFTTVWSVSGEPAWTAGETRTYTKP